METQRQRRVLIVEDEYFIAQALVEAFEQHGVVVIGPVTSIDEALAAIGEARCDAVILDLNLDGRADFRVADELTRLHMPYVFATGYDAGTIPQRHKTVERFEKPYDADALAASVLGKLSMGAPLHGA